MADEVRNGVMNICGGAFVRFLGSLFFHRKGFSFEFQWAVVLQGRFGGVPLLDLRVIFGSR